MAKPKKTTGHKQQAGSKPKKDSKILKLLGKLVK